MTPPFQGLRPRPNQHTLTHISHLIAAGFFFCSFLSWVKNYLSRGTVKKLQRKCGQCYRKACRDENESVDPLQDWLRNYHLANTDAFSLFNEFLEMGKSKLSSSSLLFYSRFCLLHNRKMPLLSLQSKKNCFKMELFLFCISKRVQMK